MIANENVEWSDPYNKVKAFNPHLPALKQQQMIQNRESAVNNLTIMSGKQGIMEADPQETQ